MQKFILRYNGPEKIKSIKAVRMVLATSLKEGKDIIERVGAYENGIIISRLQCLAIIGEYCNAYRFSDALHAAALLHFEFEPIPEVVYREDYSDHEPLVYDMIDHWNKADEHS